MKLTNEAKIGILVAAVLVILGILTWKAGNFDFNPQGYQVKVHFKNIDGIEKNAPVTLNGLEVGRVQDIQILYGAETFVELTLWLKQEAKLHQGAKAFVKNMGFLGEKYVGLTTGDDQTAFLTADTVIEGQEPTNFDKIMADGEVIAGNLKSISGQIDQRLKVNSENIDAIMVDLRSTMKNLSSISTNVNERLAVNSQQIDDMIMHFNSASKNLEELSLDLRENPWKLMYKPRKEHESKK